MNLPAITTHSIDYVAGYFHNHTKINTFDTVSKYDKWESPPSCCAISVDTVDEWVHNIAVNFVLRLFVICQRFRTNSSVWRLILHDSDKLDARSIEFCEFHKTAIVFTKIRFIAI